MHFFTLLSAGSVKRLIALLYLFVALLLVTIGLQTGAQANTQSDSSASSSSANYKYVCPMHPQIVRDHEGTCPICGMDLVKQLIEDSTESASVALSAGQSNGMSQQFAIRTARVQQQTIWKYIPTFGRVVADETKGVHVHPRASGWISDLSVRNDGDYINKGALLYKIYSPEIVAAQDDFLQVTQSRLGAQAKSLLQSARLRLQLLGLDEQTIQAIAKKRQPMHQVPIYAPQSGYVGELKVQNGMYVSPATELMSLTNLDSVWIEAEVLPLQQAWIKNNLTAAVSTDVYPGKTWESFISHIYPDANPITKAVKVRIPLMNKDSNGNPPLKLDTLVDVAIYGGPRHNVLAIPLQAVIDDGNTQRVVVQNPAGKFDVKPVVLGMQSQGIVEVISGLSVGDKIVISGQFMIDSESQIQTNLRRLMSTDMSADQETDNTGTKGFESVETQSSELMDMSDHSNHSPTVQE
ncbi:efflux RND transporter periplasmic adaptor subunit [Thiomicrorhabdus sediminis]|uniref:Efflux RND transporter periplasmic adaptor subunit n=1 Tax=Thiomicrorhabdus sediminis TaxID=2580412 RepID=A0A4P9K4B6_9GAMM|nr:efflux RND transporter periplasmic adaptor subunit [Thiomicrorhabdus sediminis]QCU89804.1 efflux RND transporter periplasmic adaptor subunit [Thiomicrorhabdus sediminis]